MFALSGLAIFGMALGLFVVLVLLSGVRYIPNDRVGVVEKRWSLKGSVEERLHRARRRGGLPAGRAARRSALPPAAPVPRPQDCRWSRSRRARSATCSRATVRPLPPTQTLAPQRQRAATSRTCAQFLAQRRPARPAAQDPARRHLRDQPRAVPRHHRGQAVLPRRSSREEDGVFRQMAQTIAERGGFAPVVIKGADDMIGVVTVHDGPSLRAGRDHRAGRRRRSRGRRAPTTTTSRTPRRSSRPAARVAVSSRCSCEGTYYINRLFATVEMIPKTVVEVGNVGVVVSYTGATARDLSGAEYKHGELVDKGERGVWSEPLLPGKYAFNTYAGKVIMVPTTNFILKWTKGEIGVAPLRREPLRGLADHEGRVRAVAAALGGRAHRLPQGAARRSALRRREAPRRADARPDGRGVLQEHRPDAHAHPAHPGAQR